MSFEAMMLPHLDAAHNLARWLMRNEQDAQDVVQEAYLRAFKSFGGFHGSNGRAWLLTIVRNTSYTLLKKNRAADLTTTFDEDIHGAGFNDGHTDRPSGRNRQRAGNAVTSTERRSNEFQSEVRKSERITVYLSAA